MSPPPPLIFLIVSPSSNPLYSASFLTQPGQKTSGGVEREGYCQFLLHGGMDMVEHYKYLTPSCNLRTIDSIPPHSISAYLTPSSYTFLLLHPPLSPDSISSFFKDVGEVWVKLVMGGLWDREGVIESKGFDDRVRAIARRYLS